MKRVLCLFDYKARTGFARVSENIVPHLRAHFKEKLKLDIIAINYFGEPFKEDENTSVISARLNDVKDDPFGRNFFLKMLSDYDYDGIFIIMDSGGIIPVIPVVKHIKEEKKKRGTKLFKSILYFPVDCEMIPELVQDLEFFDKLLTYTEYGRKIVCKLRPELKGKIEVHPHGINTKQFYPIDADDIKPFRDEWFGDNSNKFIFTNVSRNQYRKDLPTTVFAFQELLRMYKNESLPPIKDMPEPFLYLHCHPEDPLGWNLRAMLRQTDLVEDVNYMLLPKKHHNEMVDDELLNKIYNASDAMVTTPLGEGWGFIYTEAAATKKPIIAPLSTSFIEMSNNGKRGYMAETQIPFCSMTDNLIRYQSDYVEVAEKMWTCLFDSIYNYDLDVLPKIEANYKWVLTTQWDLLAKRWIEYFKTY